MVFVSIVPLLSIKGKNYSFEIHKVYRKKKQKANLKTINCDEAGRIV